MSYAVNLDFLGGKVTINGIETGMGEFAPKNELEQEIKKVIDRFYTPANASQLAIEYDDVSDLVHSDMFKGDNHSQSLIN